MPVLLTCEVQKGLPAHNMTFAKPVIDVTKNLSFDFDLAMSLLGPQ